jgi:uncharacterized membrane protein
MSRKNKPRISGDSQPVPRPIQQSVALFKAEHFSGPLPPPEMLQRYNDVAPGMAERIVALAEKQSDHRRSLESQVVNGNERRANRGQWMAFILAFAGIIAGVYLTMSGKSTEGLIAILGPLAGIVGIFVYGKSSQKKELASKDRDIKHG